MSKAWGWGCAGQQWVKIGHTPPLNQHLQKLEAEVVAVKGSFEHVVKLLKARAETQRREPQQLQAPVPGRGGKRIARGCGTC